MCRVRAIPWLPSWRRCSRSRPDLETAVRAANAAAAVVVGKRGTATVSAAELRSRILPAASLAPEEKIVFDWAVLDERLAEWRRRACASASPTAASISCIPAISSYCREARAACDRLIVGLNSDASVRRLKGEGRPMQEVHARAEVLAALEAVDLVVIFDQDTPLELIRRVRPKILAKGGDYRREEVVGHELVEERRRRGDPHRSRARLQHHQDRPSIACAAIELVTADRAENGCTNDRARGTRAGARAGVFRRRAIRLLRRGRGQPAAAGITDLAPRAARLERHPYRAAARPCRRTAPRPLGQGVRGRLLVTAERRPADASPRRRGIVVARSRSDGARARNPSGSSRCRCGRSTTSCIEAEAPAQFDFLSIDVEGHELEVLSGFDLSALAAAPHPARRSRRQPRQAPILEERGLSPDPALRKQRLVCSETTRGRGRTTRALGYRSQVLSGAAVPDRTQCVAARCAGAGGSGCRGELRLADQTASRSRRRCQSVVRCLRRSRGRGM